MSNTLTGDSIHESVSRQRTDVGEVRAPRWYAVGYIVDEKENYSEGRYLRNIT